MRYAGMDVIIDKYSCAGEPRMQVSKRFVEIQSPELVASTNEWMLEFFGREPDVIYKFPHPATGQDVLVVSKSTYLKLQMVRDGLTNMIDINTN